MINLIDHYNLRELISSFSTDYDKYGISFSLIESPQNPYLEMSDTTSVLVSCSVEVSNKENGEQIILPVPLLEVPVRTSMGLKIDGTNYELCSLNERACGWYHSLVKNSSGEMSPILELIPKHGRSLKFIYKNNLIYVKIGSKTSSTVELGIFLKAMTGKSYRQLLKEIGIRNRFVSGTLVNEISYEDSIDAILKVLLPPSSKNEGYLAIPKELRARELHNMLGPKYLKLDKLARDRYTMNTSFSHRALGLELAKPVLQYPLGTSLTAEILEEIDASDIDTLFVLKNKSMFELKKYKVETPDLSGDEILTEVNVFCNNLAGFDLFDQQFDEKNRTILSLEEAVRNEISDRLVVLLDYIRSTLLEKSISLSNLSLDKALPNDLKSFLNKCKQGFDHSQGAETTNIVSFISKESKVVLDYKGNTNDKMISIKASQQSMYDHFHIPESNKIGLVYHMNMATNVGKDGMVYAPYLKVSGGKIVDLEPVYLNPRQREGKFIAPWDVNLGDSLVRCYHGERVITTPSENIEYIEYSVLQTISLPTAMIPFLQFSEGKRITMGCNQNKQALTCLKSEAPLVSTGALCMDRHNRNVIVRAIDILSDMYFSNSLEGFIDYDSFLDSVIELDTVDNSTLGYRSYLFTTTYEGKTYEHSIVLPFYKKGTENSAFHYFLNYSKEHVYLGREIVFYSNSVDIKKYKNDLHVNLGAQTVSDEIFDFDSALGTNILMAFKSFGVPNMDDGIVICDEILGTGKLAHVKLVEFISELKNYKEGVIEKFGLKSETSSHNKDGLPKIGTYLKPRANVVGISVTENGLTHERFTTLGADVEGEVIFTSIKGDKAHVYIATIADIELGDKLSGDHGNKGVIGKIVPKKDMPYMEDGTIIQACVNPLGVPSRMNISQLFVAFLGYAARVSNSRIIISPANPDSYDIAQDYFDKIDVTPKQLYDGRTGRPFRRKTSVGILYYKKLFHTTKSKMNSCGLPTSFNPTTGQPNKGKSISGGQKVGEMETWALSALGANNFLQELFSTKSDDVYSRKDLKKHLEDGTPFDNKFGLNKNMTVHQVEVRLLGCEVELINDKYVYRPLLDKDIRGLQVKPLKYTKDSLQDDSIFGPSVGPENIDRSKKAWGYIDLNCEVIHPIWIYKSVIPSTIFIMELKEKDDKVESTFTHLGKDKIVDLIDGKYFTEIKDGTIYCSKNAKLLETPTCGIKALVSIFKVVDFNVSMKIINKRIESKLESSGVNADEEAFALLERKNSLQTLIDMGINAKDLIISSFPVIPRNFRFNMEGRPSNFDIYYRRLLTSCLPSNVLDPNKVYNNILHLVGLDASKKLASDAKTKNALEYFTGKGSDNKSKGLVRGDALSKVVCFSGRSTIIPGKIKLGYVGLPRQACYNLVRVELPSKLKNEIPIFEDCDMDLSQLINSLEIADLPSCQKFLKTHFHVDEKDAQSIVNKCDDIVRELLGSRAVAFGRQPTLHDKSIRGLIPIMVEGNAIVVHPFLCDEFNADFDGDQMWYALAHDRKSIQELLTECNPITGFYSNKDGSVSLLPSQDILLGLYLATMLHDNVLDVCSHEKYSLENMLYYNSVESMTYDLEGGFCDYSDLACLNLNGNKYISTVGRILLNNIVPNGFTDEVYDNSLNIPYINPNNYKKLRYDGLVRKGGGSTSFVRDGVSYKYNYIAVSSLVEECLEKLSPNDSLDFLDNILEFGEESCICSGITLHLDDFLENEIKDKYIEVYNKFVNETNELFELGLITEEDRKDSAIKASAYIVKTIKSGLLNSYPRNNNLFIIIDSGARGNESQVMRSCGLIGTINKSNTEQIETPILKSFKHGLTSSDVFIMANGTRFGISAVQKDTGKVGEMTRALVFGLSGLVITESDCGCGYKDLKVMYSEPKTDTSSILNKRLKQGSKLYTDTINITKQGLITADVIKYVFKHKISEVPLEDSTVFTIEYKLSKLFRSMMLNKLATDLPHLERTSLITKATLDYIEQEQLKTIKARTVITCESEEGICARCYGILHNTKTLPKVGYKVGIIAGQSIGEPATQINLDTINAAGSGNDSASAVNLFKSMTSGSIPIAFKKSIVAPSEGFIKLQDSGDSCIIHLDDVKHKVSKSELLVIPGEKVNPGQEITKGVLDVKDIPNTIPNFIEERMFRQLITYYDIFSNSNVYIDARHFEVLVKAQLSFVFILSSDDDNIKAGSIQPLYRVLDSIDNGHCIRYFNRPLKRFEQIVTISGPTSAICHHDPAKAIARICVNKVLQNDKMSLVSSIMTGTDLVDGKKAKPTPPKFKDYVDDENDLDLEVASTADDFNFFQVKEMQESVVPKALDFSNLFQDGFDLFGDNVSQEDEVSIGVSEDVPSDDNLKSSNIFGGGTDEEVSTANVTPSEDNLNGSSIFSSIDANEIDLSIEDDIEDLEDSFVPDEGLEEEDSFVDIDIDLD